MWNVKKLKILVFHPMQQHSYKTAEALMENNKLFAYCTSIYYNPKKILYKILNVVLPKNERIKMISHSNKRLNNYVKTFCEMYGLLFLLLGRIDKTKDRRFYFKMQEVLSTKMGKKVARYAIKNNVNIIIGYDTWSYGIIKELRKHKSNIKVILDYSSLYSEAIISTIREDVRKNINSKDSYSRSFEKFSIKYINEFRYEKDNSDYFFSPSSVVDESLIEYGVKKDKIFRCVYGTYFNFQPYIKKTENVVIFTYIGRISYAKGCHYLLEAFSNLNRDDFILQLVGDNTDNFKINNSKTIKYLGPKPHNEIPNILKGTDVFIIESLYDGFPLSALESFSFNIPVICTKKAGIKDFIIPGVNGYVINGSDVGELIEIISNLLNNKTMISKMKKSVKKHCRELTWDNYNKNVSSAINSIMEDL